MKVAVLPVYCKDVGRVTTLTRDWIHHAIGHVAGYYLQQSGGRENMEFRVFDWFQLDMTSAQWNEAGFDIGDRVPPLVSAGLHVDLSPFDHFAIVIDKFDARLGVRVPGKPQVLLGAQSLDPALIEHEFGHLYGAGHANLDSPTGPKEYLDNFCVMGGEGSKYSFIHAPLNIVEPDGAVTTAFSDSGPGMTAPTLLSCGWLDLAQHGTEIGGPLRGQPGQTVMEVAALRGAPPVATGGLPVVAWADGVADQRLTIELRMRDEYDRGMPDPASGGRGWVVIHLAPGGSSLQVGALPAVAGATVYVWRVVLRVTVVSADTTRGSVVLRVARETWRPWFVPRPEQTFNRLVAPAAVSREAEHLDVFKVGPDHTVWSTWWHGDGAGWRPWFQIHPETVFAQDAPITAVARRPDHLDLFVTGFDNRVWSCWWHADAEGWRPWFQIHPETVFAQDRPTVAIARQPEHLDLFRVGFDGAVWSSWWHGDGDPGGWRPWFQIHPEKRFSPRANVSAVAREPEHIDVFVVGLDGRVWSAWWHGGGDPGGWRPWFPIAGDARFDPTQRLAVVARRSDHLDLFCIDTNGVVWSAWWHADEIGWRPWFPLFGEQRFPQETHVGAIAREPEHLDVFAVGRDGIVWSAWWHGDGDPIGWRPWFPIQPETVFDPRVPVTAVARRRDHLDLFEMGFDGNVWTSFWSPV